MAFHFYVLASWTIVRTVAQQCPLPAGRHSPAQEPSGVLLHVRGVPQGAGPGLKGVSLYVKGLPCTLYVLFMFKDLLISTFKDLIIYCSRRSPVPAARPRASATCLVIPRPALAWFCFTGCADLFCVFLGLNVLPLSCFVFFFTPHGSCKVDLNRATR